MQKNKWLVFALICIAFFAVSCKPNAFTMAFSPNATKFARGYPSGFLNICDVPIDFDWVELHPHEVSLSAVTFSIDSTVLVTGGSRWSSDAEVPVAEVAVFDAATGDELRRFPIGNQEQMNTVLALAISPHDQLLAVGSEDKFIPIIDMKSGKTVSTLDTGNYGVLMLAFSMDGYLLVSYNLGKGIVIWDMLSYTAVLTLADDKYISAMAVSPYENQLAVATSSGEIKLFDTKTGILKKTISEPKSDKKVDVSALAFNPIGTQLAVASTDNKLRVWDLATGELIGIWDHRALRIIFSPNGKYLFFADEEEVKLINLWNK